MLEIEMLDAYIQKGMLFLSFRNKKNKDARCVKLSGEHKDQWEKVVKLTASNLWGEFEKKTEETIKGKVLSFDEKIVESVDVPYSIKRKQENQNKNDPCGGG